MTKTLCSLEPQLHLFLLLLRGFIGVEPGHQAHVALYERRYCLHLCWKNRRRDHQIAHLRTVSCNKHTCLTFSKSDSQTTRRQPGELQTQRRQTKQRTTRQGLQPAQVPCSPRMHVQSNKPSQLQPRGLERGRGGETTRETTNERVEGSTQHPANTFRHQRASRDRTCYAAAARY